MKYWFNTLTLNIILNTECSISLSIIALVLSIAILNIVLTKHGIPIQDVLEQPAEVQRWSVMLTPLTPMYQSHHPVESYAITLLRDMAFHVRDGTPCLLFFSFEQIQFTQNTQ